MNQDRFNDRLAVIGWPLREVARRLDLPENRVRRWATVPDDVAEWIETLATAHETTPTPRTPDRAKPGKKPKAA